MHAKQRARLILLSSILDLLVTYYMTVFQLSKKVIKAIDAIRCALFGTSQETCTGPDVLLREKCLQTKKI